MRGFFCFYTMFEIKNAQHVVDIFLSKNKIAGMSLLYERDGVKVIIKPYVFWKATSSELCRKMLFVY